MSQALLRALPESQAKLGTLRRAVCSSSPARAQSAMSVETHLPLPCDAKVPITQNLEFQGSLAGPSSVIPALRVLDGSGKLLSDVHEALLPDAKTLVKMYQTMVTVQAMDTIFYDAQRQGRISFYMTCTGEEAAVVGCAAALELNDEVFTQYREHGIFLWRGYSIKRMADQCYGNMRDSGKGRQMPVHYGAKELSLPTISSPLGTQTINAVGAAYAFKMKGEKRASAAFFGDGSSSTSDLHAAMNFAATLRCPVVFLCRNNGYAISTPTTEQFTGPGLAERSSSYGVRSIRVDGGDTLAVYCATKEARKQAVEHNCPVLVEMMSYRVGHHSTSDDSSRYRDAAEIAAWKAKDPVERLRAYLEGCGLWDSKQEAEIRGQKRTECATALKEAAAASKHPAPGAMFEDDFYECYAVFEKMPQHLQQQQQHMVEHLKRHPEECPEGVPMP